MNAPSASSAIAFAVVTSAILLTGCTNSLTELRLTEATQRANIRLRPSDAFVSVDDANGDTMRMPDGVQIVMDNLTFEHEVQPLLNPSSQRTWGPVILDATFSLKQDSIVVGVVQGPDGDASDVSRDYWLVEITEVHSVRRTSDE